MPLYSKFFKDKKLEEPKDTNNIDINAIAQQVASQLQGQVLNLIQQQINTQLQPLMTAVQALASARNANVDVDDADNDSSPQQKQNTLTAEEIRRLAREEFEQSVPKVAKNYVPKTRVAAQRLFLKNLSPEERVLYDKYSDEIESVIDAAAEANQNDPKTWDVAFDFVMWTQHADEYLPIYVSQMPKENLPPQLQTPSGPVEDGSKPKIELNEDEKTMQQIFDRTYKGGFSPEQFKAFSELQFDNLDNMIENAKAKGLLKNARSEKTDQGNPAKAG